MGRINIEIPTDIHRKLKSVSALKGVTLIEYVNQALEEKLSKMGKWNDAEVEEEEN